MRYILLFIGLFLFSPVANAGSQDAVCRTLVKHKPAGNVVYQPGVDVSGKEVVSAETGETKFEVPDVVKVPLTVDLAKRVYSLTGQDVLMETNLGMLDIHQDGRVMFGEEDWTEEIMTLCGQSYVIRETVEVVEPQPIINRTQVIDNNQVINRTSSGAKPAPDSVKKVEAIESAAQPSSFKTPKELKSGQYISKAGEGLIEVKPTQAIPPKETMKEQESDIIQGGAHREIYYNE